MTIREILHYIIIHVSTRLYAITHIEPDQPIDEDKARELAQKVIHFMNSQPYFTRLDMKLPEISEAKCEIMVDNLIMSLLFRTSLVPADASSFSIESQLKNILPLAYMDLFRRGEILEARLRLMRTH